MSGTLKGIVIWWNRDKGYGIADVCGYNRQILLHNTQIMEKGGRIKGDDIYLRGGDSIEFDVHTVNPNIAKYIRITTDSCAKEKSLNTKLYNDSTDDEEY